MCIFLRREHAHNTLSSRFLQKRYCFSNFFFTKIWTLWLTVVKFTFYLCTRYFSYFIWFFPFPPFFQTSILNKIYNLERGGVSCVFHFQQKQVGFFLKMLTFSKRYAALKSSWKNVGFLQFLGVKPILFWSNFVWRKGSFHYTVVLNDTLYNETLPHKYLHYNTKAFHRIRCSQRNSFCHPVVSLIFLGIVATHF